MLTTIKGYYENGQIVLEEKPHIQNKAGVIVTFLTDEKDVHKKAKRILGVLTGKISIPDNFNEQSEDFNEL